MVEGYRHVHNYMIVDRNLDLIPFEINPLHIFASVYLSLKQYVYRDVIGFMSLSCSLSMYMCVSVCINIDI